MDDILASIRRILNEDEAQDTGQDGAAAAGRPTPPDDEPLDLTEAMLVGPPVPETLPQPAKAADPVREPPRAAEPVREPRPAQAPEAVAETPMTVASVMTAAEGLIAPAVAAATTQTLATLLRSVASERAATVHRGGPSIEDVVREEIRPLLKEWLDQHLPPLVERLVRVEIERVIGRAQG
jgi:cell pole-organizing protein PopZ